jgi:hypothetical protein
MEGLYNACRAGDTQAVEELLAAGDTNYYDGFNGALTGGHMDLVVLMMNRGDARIDHWTLWSACYGGHMEMVQFAMDIGARRYDWGFSGACRGGHWAIAALMVDMGDVSSSYYSFINLTLDMQYIVLMKVKSMEKRRALLKACGNQLLIKVKEMAYTKVLLERLLPRAVVDEKVFGDFLGV